MSIDPLAFLDEPESRASSSDPLDFLDKEPKKLPKPAKLAARAGIGALQVAATPYELSVAPLASRGAQHGEYRKHIFEDIERLLEQKRSGVWDKQDQELYNKLISQIENPEEAEQNIRTTDVGLGSLIEKGAEKAGIDLKEEDTADVLATLAGGFSNPRSWAKAAQKAPSLLSKSGRQALKSSKETQKTASKWDSLKRAAKGNTEKEGMLNLAKKSKLSPEATTLLLQSEGKVNLLSKIAKKTKKYEGAVKELNEKLGKNYDKLKEVGKKGGYIGAKAEQSLSKDLSSTLEELDKTLIVGPDTDAAKKAIGTALSRLESQGSTVEELINTRLNLGQSINWNRVDPKGAMLNQTRETLMRAIEKSNPKVAKELKLTDQGWSKYKKFEKSLEKKQATVKIHGIDVPVANVAFGAALTFI
jgi:hypothetical protein